MNKSTETPKRTEALLNAYKEKQEVETVLDPKAVNKSTLDKLPSPKKKVLSKPLLKLNSLQSLSRDFSFLIDNELNVEDLINEIKSVDKILIQKISVFDVYQGNNIPKDKKSVSLSILIQPEDKSLTDDDLEKLSSKIIDRVFKTFAAEIRSH